MTDVVPGSSQVVKELGGRFTLSDDSHGPHAVGLNYNRLAKYLRDVGVDELWFLEGSETPNIAGRLVQARKMEGDWWEHRFWINPVVSPIIRFWAKRVPI